MNGLPDDVSEDEQFKEKLHQRVDDLTNPWHLIPSHRKASSSMVR